ncbi:MAG: adenylyl-sulfate kinase [Ferruginibacter sp.]
MLLIQMTGLSGSGKTTIAYGAKDFLETAGFKTEVIDGDEFRKHLCSDLSFSKSDRIENIKRLGIVANLLARNGVITILATINPFEESRLAIGQYGDHVKVVWLNCPLEVLIDRDTKGLYRRALLCDDHPDKVFNLSGINDRYEPPVWFDLELKTDVPYISECIKNLVDFILTTINK